MASSRYLGRPARGGNPDSASAQPSVGGDEFERVYRDAVGRWAAERHGRVRDFVDANFRLRPALRLHRRALGADLLRAPANVALVPLHLLSGLLSAGLRRLGLRRVADWLGRRRLFLQTAVARELTLRLYSELLELPHPDDAARPVADQPDALAQAIVADARIAGRLDRLAEASLRHRDDPAFRARLGTVVATWTDTRTAAGELVNSLMLAGAGAGAFQQLTPGAMSLAPLLAAAVAQHLAIVAFPLGAGLGALWYGVFAAQPSASLVAGVTIALMALGAALSAFAGVIADPLMRLAGLHERRLHRLIDALAAQLEGDDAAALRVRDHYLARVFDVADALGAAARMAG